MLVRSLLALLLGIASAAASACTIFVVARGAQVLVGANEDYGDEPKFRNHYVRFVPGNSATKKLGFVAFGYSSMPLADQAAMNEAGLFYDYNALPKLLTPRSGKPKGNQSKIYEMLTTCHTVKEAVAFIEQFDLEYFSEGQMVLADATGDSAIVERHTTTWRSLNFDFQIGTNFRTSSTPKTEIVCWRYAECQRTLSARSTVTIESLRALLERTMPKPGQGVTWYSMVCDLKSRQVNLFRKGDFSAVVRLDLNRELQTPQYVDMEDLFNRKAKPYSRS